MAEIPPSRPRPKRFLIAAASATSLLAVATVAELVNGHLDALTVFTGLLRLTCAVLWVCYVVARLIEPESAAYCVGYVDGVARRHPDREDKVTYSDRER